MARRKRITTHNPSTKELKFPEPKRQSNAARSAYFARREAAKVLRVVLDGDARRRAIGSVKSLVYSPSVRNKKATFALVCETLKHFPVIKDVLEGGNILIGKWKKQKELVYVIAYDILFGQDVSLAGDAENYLLLKKETLKLALSQILKRKGVEKVEDLVAAKETSESRRPRYVRVNTLKIDTQVAESELKQQFDVQKDDMVPDLLVLPPGVDLHNHPLVMNGSVFLQGKASSMVALALAPQPGWEVIDACSAPGNKTLHLAALMKGKGKIIACELDRERVKRLSENVKLAGAKNVEVRHLDFLNLDPEDPSHSKVRAILLDPSCSGSGTTLERLDHLMPSNSAGNHSDHVDMKRLQKLAGFQKKVLQHALTFPGVERVVYSTCSIHRIENEDVVESVMPLAASNGFELATVFPQWPRRGLPTFDGSEHLLRTDVTTDKEGFFIAMFVRRSRGDKVNHRRRHACTKSRKHLNVFVARMLKLSSPRFRFKRTKQAASRSSE